MAKKKKNTIKTVKYHSENELEIRRFIIILVIMIGLIIGIYFLSEYVVEKRKDDTETSEKTTEVSIDYDKIYVGMILNRPYDEYYVMAYDSEDERAVYYDRLIKKNELSVNAKKIYFCDLNNELNKKYKSENENGNKDAKNVQDLSFGRVTLLEIKKGKITSYIEDIEEIKNILK